MRAYVSCGAGDWVSIESFLTAQEKRQISEFYLFTRAGKVIDQLIKMHPLWKSLPVYIPYSPQEIRDFNTYSFFGPDHLRKLTGKPWIEMKGCFDLSGERIYPEILNGSRRYTSSEFAVTPIPCDIVCDPVSLNDDRLTAKGRNFTDKECENIQTEYYDRKIERVGELYTTLPQALGLVAGCSEFVGVDSMMSCWATRQPNIKRIRVKTVNPIYKRWLPIYDPLRRAIVVDSFG